MAASGEVGSDKCEKLGNRTGQGGHTSGAEEGGRDGQLVMSGW